MNTPEEHISRETTELGAQRLATTSADLKQRVLGSAHEAWTSADSDEVSWHLPVLRLAASVAIAFTIVYSTSGPAGSHTAQAASQPSYAAAAHPALAAAAASLRQRDAGKHLQQRISELEDILETE